jgi:hypothetical protein
MLLDELFEAFDGEVVPALAAAVNARLQVGRGLDLPGGFQQRHGNALASQGWLSQSWYVLTGSAGKHASSVAVMRNLC